MTTINIRVDAKLKKDASKTFASLGLDTSSAIKMFLTQVVKENGMPFRPTNNLEMIKARWDEEVKEALKEKGYTDVKEMHRDLLKGI